MRRLVSAFSVLVLVGGLTPVALAQPVAQPADPTFGMEFEFAGAGNRIVRFEEMPFKNYKEIMKTIVRHYGGRASDIKKVEFEKETSNLERYPDGVRKLFRAEWKDPRGRTWLIEPEFVASTGYDGYELVTPPMDDTRELEEVLTKVRSSGLVREGRRSGVHLTIDGKKLIKPNGDARALANMILMHENYAPALRRMFNPVRGGGYENYFARDLATDHYDLLREIDALPPEARTRAKLEELFKAREGREAELHEVDVLEDPTSWKKLWKYRSMNLAKTLNINELHDGDAKLVEFRMFDLADPETHRLEADLYRRMARRAEELASDGETVRLTRTETPAGEDPAEFNLPSNSEEAKVKAREMIESLGLDPVDYEGLIERNFQPRELRSRRETAGLLDNLPGGRIEHDGKAFTYGFELEGRGNGFVNIAVPTDPEVASRWGGMSEGEKRAYYDEVVGTDHSSVKSKFDVDTAKHPWLDPYWYVESTGNWEIHSRVHEDVDKITDAMRTAKKLTGASGKGFHLHMRDNAPDWETLETRGSEYADFLERASNWIYLKRVERLRTDLSLKSWSNARLSTDEIDNIANLEETDRATLRVAEVNRGGDNEYIDLEIRGFTKYVDDVETLAKIFTRNLKNGEFGTWKHTDNPLETGGGSWYSGTSVPDGLSYAKHFEEYLRTVEGEELTPERRKIIEGLQDDFARKAKGDMREYSTGVATPLLPWEKEGALSESDRRAARFAKEEYLGWLKRYSDRIMAGEFGVDLSLASEEALTEKLGLSADEAKALVAYRRARGGKLSPAEGLRALTMRSGSSADADKIARVDKLDMNAADAAALRARLGLTAAEARSVTDYRDANDAEASLRKAGVTPAARRKLSERAESMDVGSAAVTAEDIAARTGLTRETADRIVAYREANGVHDADGLKAAGLDADEVEEVLGLVRPGANVAEMSAAEIADALGISVAKAEALVTARTTNAISRWSAVKTAGLTDAAATKLRAEFANLAALNGASRADLLASGITPNQADKLLTFRDASDITDVEILRRVLGPEAGGRAHAKVTGFDLRTADVSSMRDLGLDWDVATKIANHRDAHSIGRGGPMSSYSAERAAEELSEADVIDWGENDKLERGTEAVDLASANKNTLMNRLGMSAEKAAAFLAMRDAHKLNANTLKNAGFNTEKARELAALAKELNLRSARVADIMNRTGLTRAKAEKVKALARLDYKTITADALVEAGIPRARAERLVGFRAAATEAGGLDYNEIVRRLRLRVRRWVRDSKLSDSLLRSLLPRDRATVNVVRSVEGEGEGFSSVRRAARGAFVPSKIAYSTVGDIFSAVRSGGISRNGVRVGEATTEGERTNLTNARGVLDALKLEIVETNDILASRSGETVRVSTGLLNEIAARADALPTAERGFFRSRILGLILAHETAHAGGLRSEKLADAESIKVLEATEGLGRVFGRPVPVTGVEVREAVLAFDRPTGATHVDNFFNRLRNLFRYGTTGRRVDDLERAARGEEIDGLAKWRRADGTLNWKKLTRDGALREGAGTAHFALALFLKELAVVVRTGDRTRIEEFFDGLLTTDFYVQYGMFVVGARVGEVAYARYLERYIRPRFVNGILKSNLVLAAGLALPEIVNGTFTGKGFAISLTSLGLASAAVKTGISGIKWVVNLKKAREAGTLARTGLAAGRLARFGGWFYTAAELAVILYFAEDMENAINAWVDRREARKALAESSREFFDAAGDPGASPESVSDATRAYHDAWTNYRDYLYTPLYAEEGLFASRLEKAAREAKIAADRRAETLKRVGEHDALRRNIEARHGSLERYAESLVRADEAKLTEEIDAYSASYNEARERLLKEVYDGNRRGGDLLGDVDDLDWLVLGARGGSAGDPYADTFFGRMARSRARSSLDDAVEGASTNRLETYDDEARVLAATRDALRRSGRADLADAIDETRGVVARLKRADDRLAHGDGLITFDPLNVEGFNVDERIDRASSEAPGTGDGE